MTIRVVAFGRVRELLAWNERTLALADASSANDVWAALATETAALRALGDSTRFARNGTLVSGDAELHEADELALLPPVGGG
jgi:molybdopterin converting factor small subunit